MTSVDRDYVVVEKSGLWHVALAGSGVTLCQCWEKDAADGIAAALDRDAKRVRVGPPKSPITVTAHHDPHADEWVIRLNTPMGFLSIGAMNAEEEARAVEAVLQGALELEFGVNNMNAMNGPATEDPAVRGFWRGQDNANNIVEGHRIRELAACIMDREAALSLASKSGGVA